MTTPHISVVVGAQNARATIRDCLNALLAQTVPAEVIVVDGSQDGTAEIVAAEFPQVQLIRGDARALMPHLWQQGVDRAQAPAVALTIAHCVPSPRWLEHLLAGLEQGAAGVGGPITGPEGQGAVAWALYFARYSAYIPPGAQGIVPEIPGDNAAYSRAALEPCAAVMANGFWETLVHVCLHQQGGHLVMLPEAEVRLGGGASLLSLAQSRFRHGRHYGSTRPGSTPVKRLVRAAAAPLVIPLMLLRIARRVQPQQPGWMRHFYTALPALLMLLGAWTLGEFSGYLLPQRS